MTTTFIQMPSYNADRRTTLAVEVRNDAGKLVSICRSRRFESRDALVIRAVSEA